MTRDVRRDRRALVRVDSRRLDEGSAGILARGRGAVLTFHAREVKSAKRQLERLARHLGSSQRAVLETLLAKAERQAIAKMPQAVERGYIKER